MPCPGELIDWDNSKPLHYQPTYHKRMTKEALEIKTPIRLNREDGLKISNTWNLVLEKHKKDNIKPRGSPKKHHTIREDTHRESPKSMEKHHPGRDRPYLGRACKRSQ
jgi:hypothetical protein